MSILAAALPQVNTDAPVLVAQNIGFAVIAALMVIAAIRVVTTKNVVHAAFYLVLVLGGVAAQFVLLASEFLAVVQVLVYIGAVVVLFLFGIMLTKAPIGGDAELTRRNWYAGAGVAALMLGLLAYVLIDAFGRSKLPADLSPVNGSAASVSDAIFSTYLLPFEVVSVLLTAALIGAIVIARRD